mgnify:CR=1 FL=1
MVDLNPEKPSNMENLDFLIIDEFSMVDVSLLYHLLDATTHFKQIILQIYYLIKYIYIN